MVAREPVVARDVEQDLRFRAEFGLSTERALVTALSTAEVGPNLPVPMTKAEQEEWARRLSVEEGIQPLVDYG